MFTKTNIPETVSACLVGDREGFGESTKDPMLNHQMSAIQAIVTGNRCGHVPSTPRYYDRPENHKKRPSVLEDAINQLKDVYARPKKFLQELNKLKNRQKRSERREGIMATLQVMLHYMNLATLETGFYTEEGILIGLDLEYIAKKAKLSFSRAKRAINDLVKAGYIKLTRQFTKRDNGAFEGKASIRAFTVRFFMDIGTDMLQLNFARAWKRKQDEKALQKNSHKKLKHLFKSFLGGMGGLVNPIKKYVPPAKDYSVEQKKAMVAMALKRYYANPERSVGDYFLEIKNNTPLLE